MADYLTYTWLEARRQWRDREILVFRLGLPLAIYLVLLATTDGDRIITASTRLSPLPAETARMLALAALAALISGLAAGPALADERGSGWLRQLRVTPLRPTAAVAAKIAVAMSFALPAMAMVAAASGVTDNVRLGWGEWVEVMGLMWLATIPLTALGTLIGLAFSAEAFQAVHTLTWVVLWLLGGIFTPVSDMPDLVAAVGQRLPSNGLIEVGWAAATDEPIPAPAAVVLAAWTVGAVALAALTWRRILARSG